MVEGVKARSSGGARKGKLRGRFSRTFHHGWILLCKRRDSGVWYARFRVPTTGVYRERSLGTRVRRDAQKAADVLSAQIVNGKYGIADGTIPVRELIARFLDAKQGRVKPKTHARLVVTINAFTSWLDANKPHAVRTRHITPADIRQFQQDRIDEGLHPRSVDRDVENLHTMFLWGVREGLLLSSPADYSRNGTVERYRPRTSGRDTYTEKEVAALLTAAEQAGEDQIRDLIVVFAGTGARFEEIAHLTPRYLHFDTVPPEIEIRAHGGWSPKDPDEVKRIPMLSDVEEVLMRRTQACNGQDELLFKRPNGKRVDVSRSREKLQKLFAAAEIDGGRKLHWHAFRNYFVIRCLKKGVAIPAIRCWTGHDSASMILYYAEVIREDDLRQEFAKLTTNPSGN